MRTHQLTAELEAFESYKSYVEFLRSLAQTGMKGAKRAHQEHQDQWDAIDRICDHAFAQYIADRKNHRVSFTAWEDALGQNDFPPSVLDGCIGISETGNEEGAALLVVIGSNRGLCGRFHKNLIKEVSGFEQRFPTAKVLCIGSHTRSGLTRRPCGVRLVPAADTPDKMDSLSGVYRIKPAVDILVGNVVLSLLHRLASRLISSVHLLYYPYSATPTVTPTIEQVLPIRTVAEADSRYHDPLLARWLILEPSPSAVAATLLVEKVKGRLLKAILGSSYTEHHLRLQNSTSAHAYLEDQVRATSALIRKTRRESITNELVGLLAGAEAYEERG
jgi:F-type H+-transporting ATPase subunit gamma